MARSGSALSRRSLLLASLWLTAAAAEWGALRPVIFKEHVMPEVVLYHVVGGSFAACGLLAWHRRPVGDGDPLGEDVRRALQEEQRRELRREDLFLGYGGYHLLLHAGRRLPTNAPMPSWASSSSALEAMTVLVTSYARCSSRSTWA